MKKFEIVGNKAINKAQCREHTFEIVETVPANFFVWNIGDNMANDEYIPFCEMLDPNDPKNYTINSETLKTVRLPKEEVRALRNAAHDGIWSLKEAKKAIKSKRSGYRAEKKRAIAKTVIEIFERIT